MKQFKYEFILFLILLILLLLVALNIGFADVSVNLIPKLGAAESLKSNIIWENKITPLDEIIKHMEYVENNIEKFEPLGPKEMKILNTYAKKNKLPVGQLVSLRHIIATQKSINAKRKSHKYYQDIQNSATKEISKIFNYPVPPLEIVKMLGNKAKLNPNIQKYAEEHDSENTTSHSKILKDADEFENNLVEWIRKEYPNIRFKTQNQLIKEQTAKFGRPFATPDILFDDPVLIKVVDFQSRKSTEHLIRWIDAKNYTLIKVPFIMEHVHKQAEKYLQNYGPGALAFHYGFTKGIGIPQILLLDASFIN